MTAEQQNNQGKVPDNQDKLRVASHQWDEIYKLLTGSNEKLQQLVNSLTVTNSGLESALNAGDLVWWSWEYSSGKLLFKGNSVFFVHSTRDELPHTFDDFSKLIHPDDLPALLDQIKQHVRGEKPNFEIDFRWQIKPQEWKWLFFKGKIVDTDILGKPVRLAGIILDIDNRKIKERKTIESKEKSDEDNRLKSLFLADMSHEIYTPMAGVIGMAQILRQSELNQEQTEYLDVIVKSATNLMSILNDVLEYSKIEAGKVEILEKPFSVAQVVGEVAMSFVDTALEKGLEMLTFQDPNVPFEVVGDPIRLRQILKIFMDNALKFTEKGEIRIESEFLNWDDESVSVRFNVCDTGIGISEQDLKKIFYSFSKLDTSQGRKFGGGGLGLAIAKHLIDRMNGSISVESILGSGTTFSFTIPFDRYKDSEITDPMKKKIGGQKVLIIDPALSHTTVLRNYFERWDCEVEVSHDTQDATHRIHHQAEIKKPFQLILVEYQMPEINGLQFAAQVKKDPLFLPSKILLTTSRKFPVTASELASAGVWVCIIRPYTLNHLKSRIVRALSQLNKEISQPDDQPEVIHDTRKRILNILLVEDSPINQKVALVTLEKIGHHADLAENGKIAVEMFSRKKYDLILMDIYMPEMDGLEATRQIRALEAKSNEEFPVQICAITANTSPEDEEKCFKAGMNTYISKPFKLEELTRLLNKV